MRVLVTGATGLVGNKLCKELLRRDHDLIVVGRDPEDKFRNKFSLPCEYQTWDKLDFNDIDVVFHLAGDSIASERWNARKKKSILESRVLTTQKLIKAFQNNWPKVYIGASAIGIYGNRFDEVLKEESTNGAGFLSDVCQQWELSAEPFFEHSRTVLLRIGVVLSQSGGFLEPMENIFTLGLGGKIGDGEHWMSWIHITDLVNLLIYSMENKINGVFNAVSPEPVKNKEWSNIFAQKMKVKAFLPTPKIGLKIALGEMSQLALFSQRVSSNKLIQSGFKFQFENIVKALDDIYSWKSRTYEFLFETEQWIPIPKNQVFAFFSDAKNLEKITPPWLNFKILNQSTENIVKGTIFDYKLNFKGFPINWISEIKAWDPELKFVDDQLRGPYKKWYHTHLFEQLKQGTLMKDHVIYELPLAQASHPIAGKFVKNDISKIFAFRKSFINTLKEM